MLKLDYEKSILEQVENKHNESDGKCGLLIPMLIVTLNSDYKTIKPILAKIYNEKKITIRDGINGKMIFKKQIGSNL